MTTEIGATARTVHGVLVRGIAVDAQTRCGHWHGATDIIALRMKCCGAWFSCYDCHAALAEHPATTWPIAERDRPTVLCGACGTTLSTTAYLECDSTCPSCAAAFNPGCALHHHLYFETERPVAAEAKQ